MSLICCFVTELDFTDQERGKKSEFFELELN